MSVEKANTGPVMHLLVILYGSRKREEVSLDRFGEHQRRVEIDMRPRLPRPGMTPLEISQWAHHFVGVNYQSFKHSQKWHCEYCGAHDFVPVLASCAERLSLDKPARMSESQLMSWTHLDPPRMNIYVRMILFTISSRPDVSHRCTLSVTPQSVHARRSSVKRSWMQQG